MSALTETVTETRADIAAGRVNKVVEKVNMTNRSLPEGMAPFQLPLPQMEQKASLDALISTLIEAGVMDEQAFVDAKHEKLAALADEVYEQIQVAKRQALGLLIARG